MIYFVDPKSKIELKNNTEGLIQPNGEVVAKVINNIPRFVPFDDTYDRSFGWQWNHWEKIRSSQRGAGLGLDKLIIKRTNFDKYDLKGRTLLECGMGGGDDTEVLLSLPFSEVHSFDISNAVDRAAKFIKDDRLVLSQSSIFEIPYPDYSFDVVYCHRVLQHTPDPKKALAAICKKVKLNGILFAHAYKRSKKYMAEWRYKYRFITKRLPIKWIYKYVNTFGPFLHRVNNYMYRKNRITHEFAYRYIPFYKKEGVEMKREDRIELEKLITFDALTPRYDSPMTSENFFGIIESQGFEIQYKHDPLISPLYCTAIRKEIK